MGNKYKVERSLLISKNQLSNNDYNPNKTTERQQEAIAESLNNYGQLTAIQTMNGRRLTAKSLMNASTHSIKRSQTDRC